MGVSRFFFAELSQVSQVSQGVCAKPDFQPAPFLPLLGSATTFASTPVM